VAVHVERRFPQLNNELINALQLGMDRRVGIARHGGGARCEGGGKRSRLPASQGGGTRRARWMAVAAGRGAPGPRLVAGLAFDRFANALQRLIFPARNIAALGRVRILEVNPGTTRLNKGADLDIVVAPRARRRATSTPISTISMPTRGRC